MSNTSSVSLRSAAQRLGVHENTIRNWIDRGLLHGQRLPSGTRRLPTAEVERIERAMFAMPTSTPAEQVVAAPKPLAVDDVSGLSYPDI